ncbi:hypothetical protein ACP275_06G159700 [Erythranthe tilingii]
MAEIPEEIIIEILPKLPVKSLLRFKCVSKSWRSLISSKHMVKAHLKESTENKTFPHHSIVSATWGPSTCAVKSCPLYALLTERTALASPLINHPTARIIGESNISASCNGLICIMIGPYRFSLWNPATRESKDLPHFLTGVERSLFTYVRRYGFAFAEINGDYKVFALFHVHDVTCKFFIVGKVYSLNSDSWGGTMTYSNGSPSFDDTFHKLGTFASGKPHWISDKISDKNGTMSEWKIVYFDFNSETTGVVEKPSCVEKDSYNIRNLRLGVVDECLCLFCVGTNRFDIWVRNKYGAEDSWGRFLNVSYASIYCNPLLRISSLNPSLLTLLLVLPNGEVLFAYVSKFLIYNREDNRFRECCIYDFGNAYQAGVYVESLASLNST